MKIDIDLLISCHVCYIQQFFRPYRFWLTWFVGEHRRRVRCALVVHSVHACIGCTRVKVIHRGLYMYIYLQPRMFTITVI